MSGRKKGAERLTHLGATDATSATRKETPDGPSRPSRPSRTILETFDNSHPAREYQIRFNCPEFTAICPITSQPDFGRITISYVAADKCIESKSLKLYLFSYRNHGAFHEEVVNLILDDCVAVCRPRRMTVQGSFNPRGGISIHVEASYDENAAQLGGKV
ncbi:MAG: preQ(1) synthase [Candidatus Zixiibacteriota bacterium]